MVDWGGVKASFRTSYIRIVHRKVSVKHFGVGLRLALGQVIFASYIERCLSNIFPDKR